MRFLALKYASDPNASDAAPNNTAFTSCALAEEEEEEAAAAIACVCVTQTQIEIRTKKRQYNEQSIDR